MVDIAITAANVVADASAVAEFHVAGATITAGQLLYQDTGDSNKMKLCDSDSATALARVPFGIALNGASSGQPVKVLKSGLITIGGTVVAGELYLASDNAGGIMPVGDVEVGDYTSVIGIATTTGILKIGILAGGVAHG